MIGLPDRELNQIRGEKITMIFQEPMTSLDPLYRIGAQLAEPLRFHRGLRKAEARPRIIELLRLVGIPEPERRIDAYPHELSGGQRQRVMIAMALACDPDILIADEPTTALDVTVQAQILELLAELQARLGMAIVFITHDLGIVQRFADRVYVMRAGEVVETGPTAALFARPEHPYTRMLLAAEPEGTKAAAAGRRAGADRPATTCKVTFRPAAGSSPRPHERARRRRGQRAPARGADHRHRRRVRARASRRSAARCCGCCRATGRIAYLGRPLDPDPAAMRPLRRELQLVFQDPFGSLSPAHDHRPDHHRGPLDPRARRSRSRERDRRAGEALAEVGPRARRCATATRTSSPAASGSASPSPGR